ncbi:MAG: hypothetical protein H7338_13445 [Candidatus Sericytochromatia bacterium]|nr:hypothetical protein [Candidatus Sericytochromatia bacterium]
MTVTATATKLWTSATDFVKQAGPTRLAGASGGISATSYGASSYSSADSYCPSAVGDSPIGLVSAVFASSTTVSAVAATFGGGSIQGVISGQAGKFSKGFLAARKGLAATVSVGTIVGAGFSLVLNAVDVIKGKRSIGSAAGRVAADTVGAAVSGIGSVLIGGAATAALGAVGIVGLPLTIAGLGISVLAGVACDAAFRRSGIAGSIRNGISSAMGD